jgi:predicted anti-sigma-YlaC factor YlaD
MMPRKTMETKTIRTPSRRFSTGQLTFRRNPATKQIPKTVKKMVFRWRPDIIVGTGDRYPAHLSYFHALAVTCALTMLPGCALAKRKAVGMVASTLASSGDVFTRDDDLELVGQAIPFGLKLYESLLESAPKNKDLLIATCSNFTQYGLAYLETEALELGEAQHHDEVAHLNARALKLYLRARGYCLRAMEVRFPGIKPKLLADPARALTAARKSDVPLLYWTAASWGSAIGLGVDKPELVIDMPVVRALADRALALDSSWGNGTLQEMFISLESLPEALGGSPARAREHFARAIELEGGRSPGPYVALAVGVAMPAQDRTEFESLLRKALAIDPEQDPHNRLITLVQQRRARALLDHIDTMFTK